MSKRKSNEGDIESDIESDAETAEKVEDDVEATNKSQLMSFSHFSASDSSSKPYDPYLNEKTAAKSVWLPKNKVALIYDIRGKFWRIMGFTCAKQSLLQPEEALYLLERGQLIVEKHILDADESEKLHPHYRRYSLNNFYEMIVNQVVPFQCYLVYLKLRSLNYATFRHTRERIVAIEDDAFLFELKSRFECQSLLEAAVSFDIFINSYDFRKKDAESKCPLAHVIVMSSHHTFSASTMVQLLNECVGVPMLLAFVCPSGNVVLEEFADASVVLDLDNSGVILGAPIRKGKRAKKQRPVENNEREGEPRC